MKLILIIALLLAWAGAGYGQKEGKETLKGIHTVEAVVENFNEDNLAGLSKTTIQTDVELRLRHIGIVVSKDDSGFLYVIINGLEIKRDDGSSSGVFCYMVSIEYRQNAALLRNPSIIALNATTWSTAPIIGVTIREHLHQKIRDAVARGVDRFLNDYLTVNPVERAR